MSFCTWPTRVAWASACRRFDPAVCARRDVAVKLAACQKPDRAEKYCGNLQGIYIRIRPPPAPRARRPQMRAPAWAFVQGGDPPERRPGPPYRLDSRLLGDQGDFQAALRTPRPQLPERHPRPGKPHQRSTGQVDLDRIETPAARTQRDSHP